MWKKKQLLSIFFFFLAGVAKASIIIPMFLTSPCACGKFLGIIKADDTIYGLLLTPYLKGLPPGIHGVHIHNLPCCGRNGMLAGGHFDPVKTGRHLGPYNSGHLGDLPVLIVNRRGCATLPILAPRLKLALIEGRSLIIDACGDNYSDCPRFNGGGGPRIACGVIGYAH